MPIAARLATLTEAVTVYSADVAMLVLVAAGAAASISRAVLVTLSQETNLGRGLARQSVSSSPSRPPVLAVRTPTIALCMSDAAQQSRVLVIAPAVIARRGQAAQAVAGRIWHLAGLQIPYAEAARREAIPLLMRGRPLFPVTLL